MEPDAEAKFNDYPTDEALRARGFQLMYDCPEDGDWGWRLEIGDTAIEVCFADNLFVNFSASDLPWHEGGCRHEKSLAAIDAEIARVRAKTANTP